MGIGSLALPKQGFYYIWAHWAENAAKQNNGVQLPQGWEEAKDPDSGQTYYVNVAAGASSWNPPPQLSSQMSFSGGKVSFAIILIAVNSLRILTGDGVILGKFTYHVHKFATTPSN